MILGTYLILIQNILLVLVITAPTWVLCKGNKKKTPVQNRKNSNETLMVKSAIKPPDVSPSQMTPVKDEKKEEPAHGAKEDKKDSAEKKESEGGAAASGESAGQNKERSQKPFPKFEMPTESKKKKKVQENENEKKEKIKNGFYQEKSDDDDTLEKIVSLDVEKSDKTKRSQKKQKK